MKFREILIKLGTKTMNLRKVRLFCKTFNKKYRFLRNVCSISGFLAVQKCEKLVDPKEVLQYEYLLSLLAECGVDTPENEPSEVS